MNNTVYHPRGWFNGLLRPGARHVRELWRNPAYRALHHFHGQLAGMERGVAAELRFEGRTIRLGDGPSFLSAWDEIFVNGIYDLGPLDHEPLLVDAGANIGLAALYWKLRYGRFKYLGFEPDPDVAECCRENLRAWNVDGELVQAALGRTEGLLGFARDRADGGHLLEEGIAAGADTIQVPVQRLSARLPAVVDLLKIDVEGAEADVLADIEPLLSRVRNLFVEWHAVAGKPGLGELIAKLEAAGFGCYPQVAVGPAQPFMFTPAGVGFVQNLNLYAIRR